MIDFKWMSEFKLFRVFHSIRYTVKLRRLNHCKEVTTESAVHYFLPINGEMLETMQTHN